MRIFGLIWIDLIECEEYTKYVVAKSDMSFSKFATFEHPKTANNNNK